MSCSKNTFIQTYCGAQFWPGEPKAEDIRLEDIAHAIAHQCRYAGHCTRFYSVAEHCWHLWSVASAPNKKAALMHDCTEAYLVDVPTPVKAQLIGYYAIEDRLARIIADKFNVTYPWPDEVHKLDYRILLDERAQVMSAPLYGPEAGGWPTDVPPLGVTLQFWTPEEAEAHWLMAFHGDYIRG